MNRKHAHKISSSFNSRTMNKIERFLAQHYEAHVIPCITKHIPKDVFYNGTCSLVDDIQHFDGCKKPASYAVVICSQPLNDFGDINQHLKKIYDASAWGGTFVGKVEILDQRKRRIAARFNKFTSKIINLYDFIFKRVLRQLNGFRSIYRRFNLVKHHCLSQCEALGRLRYCGFEILDFQKSSKYAYFVARKNSIPLNGKPHDGLLIKIPKVGLNGRIIYCYKLRTMHAYADYLHDYILDNLKLDNNGKVIADFRKTRWGRFIRKTWLDEIPQLYNILKGDLSFIGLRPLSPQFLALYPEEWREMRQKTKPGFVPPYYADCPRTFEEIIESEKRYSRLKRRHPITTDMIYFLRVVYSFLSGKARTG